MKRILLLLTVAAISGSLHAQITIDSSDVAIPGVKLFLARDTIGSGLTIAPGSASAQTFDYSAMTFQYVDSIEFYNPTGFPGANRFPQSNLMLEDAEGLAYLRKSDTSLLIDGLWGDQLGTGVTTAVDILPFQPVLRFPSTYGSSFQHTSIIDSTVEDNVTGIYDSLRLRSHRLTNSEIDAFGTLITPGGTYPNTLRQFTTLTSRDTIWGYIQFIGWQQLLTTINTTYEYGWLAKNEEYYVLQARAAAPNGNIFNSSFRASGNPVPAVTLAHPECYAAADGSITVDQVVGGIGPYSYRWDDGSTAASRTGLAAGVYQLTVYGQADSATVSYTLQDPDSLLITAVQIQDETVGNDGSIDIDVSGGTVVAGYTYAWSDGSTTQDITGLVAGTYTVTVTDDNLCTNSASFTVGNSTSVTPIEEQPHVRIYPNPVREQVQLVAEKPLQQLEVWDASGRLVGRWNPRDNQYQLATDSWAPGWYLIRWNTSEQSGQQTVQKIGE